MSSRRLNTLRGMVGKLAKTPKKRIDEARGECNQARSGHYPSMAEASYASLWPGADRDKVLNAFPALLLKIDDPDATCQLLRLRRRRNIPIWNWPS